MSREQHAAQGLERGGIIYGMTVELFYNLGMATQTQESPRESCHFGVSQQERGVLCWLPGVKLEVWRPLRNRYSQDHYSISVHRAQELQVG